MNIVLCAASALAQASGGKAEEAVPLTPAKELRLTVAPRSNTLLRFVVHAGTYNEVAVRVATTPINGVMARVVLIDSAGKESPTVVSDGGSPVLRIPLIAERNGSAAIRVTPVRPSKEDHQPVLIAVLLAPERTPAKTDEDFAAAWGALSKAEAMRRSPGSNVNEAIASYKQAVDLAFALHSPSLQRQAMTGEARFLIYRAEKYQEAVLVAGQATQLAPTDDEVGIEALAWKTLASALALVDRYPESIEATKKALQLYQRIDDQYWQGVVLGNLSFIYRETGETKEALAAAEQALQIARSIRDDYGIAFTLSALGAIHQSRAEYQDALEAYYKSLDTPLPSASHQVRGEVWMNLGELYSELGDWERASNAYQQALPLVRETDDGVNEIEVLGQLGEVEAHQGRTESASNYFHQGLELADKQKLVRQRSTLLVGLARSQIVQRQFNAAEESLTKAVQAAQQIHQIDGEAAAWRAFGDLKRDQSLLPGSREAYQRSLDLWHSIPNASEAAMVEADLARLDEKGGDLVAAREKIYRTLDGIEASRGSIASSALRTSFFASRHGYYEYAVDLLMQMNRRHPARGYAAEAWAVAERARARTLLDALEAQRSQSSGEGDQELVRQQQALAVQIRDVEDKLARLTTNAADTATAQKCEQSLHRMFLQADQLESRIRSADPAYRAVAPSTALTASTLVNQLLDEHAAVLEYLTGEHGSYLWVLTHGGIRSYSLPNRKTLANLVAEYQRALLARDDHPQGEDFAQRELRIEDADREVHRLSLSLATTLLPAELNSQIRRIAVVADGPLLSIPFAGLQLPHSAGQYLIERYEVIYEPSAATLATLLRQKSAQRPVGKVAVFADPVYTRSDPRLRAGSSSEVALTNEQVMRWASDVGLTQLPRLPSSRQEALAIESIAGEKRTALHLDFDATPAQVKSTDWSSFDVAHFAAHAISSRNEPELSGIVLSMVDRNGDARDGVLWLHDIYQMRIPVRLMTLSACSTAQGGVIPGEGLLGLTRAFLYAGAQRVVGTLWSADDAGTSLMMTSFYRDFLDHRLSAPGALRSAQLALLRDRRYRAPYYWAGFIAEGDWRAQ